jgi:hypothetical protein
MIGQIKQRGREESMRCSISTSSLLVALLAAAPAAMAQQQAATKDRSYVGQMTEEQIRQKIEGLGYSQVSEIKKVPVTRYRWSAKAIRSGQPMEVTVDELGQVSAK